ncbi:hypothetical protein M1M14_gp168 [Synechococcus phage ACG-2014e]|jgi:hypothetical protein|uniref:Uncharacterized protein n=3 Tax=Kyanoviridae TaxID=2946160 RepID=A0A1D8KMR1_9CAUD|nr:hypothetical protein AAJ61_gp178 [Synechococcus phage ACG-2014j]YP_009134667.1 hypothetical protein AAJ58_gp165 [Synechococcus phage ACG-2014e]YP_009320615.1 hypothetical protein BOQ05_gp082 [Synechococcus phage S-CAM4]YP_010355563.1 hypothetical protein M1M13_gp174 [Synechococcus phage ACG-2014j]YP_010355780.1 hypothetical protein M1M14_gp168 [Synechococcus phage ACG-2014e]AIX20631.1 hypothetical protein Syn7803C85_168 [Synechococcus phage ACG-2014e]AIX24073.1 hypothetical protein Syn7803
MINLDARYHEYLHSNKCFTIDGACEKVIAYGWTDDGVTINGYYVLTKNYKLQYNMKEQCISMQQRIGV